MMESINIDYEIRSNIILFIGSAQVYSKPIRPFNITVKLAFLGIKRRDSLA